MGALLPYGRAVALMGEFLPLGDIPAIETVRGRTLTVGARLERAALRAGPTAVSEAKTVAVAVDGGHVKSVRSYRMRSFEILSRMSKTIAHKAPLSYPAQLPLASEAVDP